jgi:hypothetical protein
MKNVGITLVQGEAKLHFNTELSSRNFTEISGTLSGRILALMYRKKKYNINLGGFSFARKFDVRIEIDGMASDGTNTIANGLVQFGITIQNNEKSFEKFHGFIGELVEDILTGRNVLEGTLDEILDAYGIQLIK